VKNKQHLLHRIWPWLVGIKYLFSVFVTVLAFQTVRTPAYLLAGLAELAAIILLTNAVLSRNKALGHVLSFVLLLLYNVQMLVLHFSGTFTTVNMVTNLASIAALSGKFLAYIRLIVPMVLCTLIPAKPLVLKRSRCIAAVVAAIVLQASVFLCGMQSYSLWQNTYTLCRTYITHQAMIAKAKVASAADREAFYQEDVSDFIVKPAQLSENPNVILIFTEGLSAISC
jgi:glucan phosphoethanolaminetransferase (alkaline phosphatase superfamily)